MRRSHLLFLFVLTLTQPAAADEPTPPVYVIQSASAEPIKGQIKQIDDQWTIVLSGATSQRVAGTDFVSLRRSGMALPAYPLDSHVLFANGDRLLCTVGELTGTRLSVTTPLG